MKKLCTKWFNKWAKKSNLNSESLLEAVGNLEKGLSTADLGGNLYKVRVQRSGKGKSSGFRTIIVYRREDKAIFLYGFGKNEKSNIDKTELTYFKKLGNDLIALDTEQIAASLKKQILFDLEV
ncbi:MAG: type II toxin-antitoxin system RelE/ParE family toxin [Candidatus Electrothrix sp. Rat3]|nr:type II toxin-antitoxin system RelE/ParE family toxin [Candidatus Electrothrix rattekaaiensis]